MIKLTDLLEATSINKKSFDTDFLQKGFKLSKPEIDPETGTSSTTVTYLPKFEEIRRQILTMRKEFQPFKFSPNPDIAGVAKEINTNMTKLSQLIFALDKMIELQRK
jgi:hypothetical protein